MAELAVEGRFEDFVGLVNALYKEVQRIKTARAERLGLRASDVMGLYHLARAEGPLTSAELARRCEVDRAAMSRSVTRMAAAGFVSVDEGSYRAPVSLTEKGVSTFREVEQEIVRVVERAGSTLSDDDRAGMYRSLASVLEELRAL